MRVLSVKKRGGVAGQYQLDATIQYEGEGKPFVLGFVGSVYGGPVVMVSGSAQTFVSDPGRFGEFGEDWVHRFLGA